MTEAIETLLAAIAFSGLVLVAGVGIVWAVAEAFEWAMGLDGDE